MRNDPKYSLDKHELAAMVHLVLFYGEQHIETCA
jgi:hypothetical protein